MDSLQQKYIGRFQWFKKKCNINKETHKQKIYI